MNIDALIDELEGVRQRGGYFIARCPAHEDLHQSLQVSEREDGSIGIHCHAGCSPEAVMAALGHHTRDLFPEQQEHIYVYEDEDRSPLYEVVRKPGKEFFQRRYLEDGTKENGLNDTRRVLYMLPDVLAADPGRWVFVVEGEKDAEAFWDRGYVATCNVGGAGKWTEDYSRALVGKKISIVQDRDDAGRKHASQVMLSLRKAGVETVRLLEARKGKDAFDHFAAGYDVEDFIEPSFFTPLDFTKPAPLVEWVFDGYIARGDLALVSGVPGLGKSWFTMGLATAVANSHPEFLGRAIQPGRVLYFDEENPQDVIVTRMVQKLGHTAWDNMRYIAAEGLRLDTHPELLMQEVMVYQPRLIIIDSLARVHAKEENSFAEMSEILNQVLKPLARDTGAAVILIHHSDKAGHGPRGSGDIEAAVDVSIELKGAPGAGAFGCRIRKSRRRKSDDGMFVTITDVPGMGTRLEVHR